MEGDNDDELSFITIATATANVLAWLKLNEKQTEQCERKDAENDDDPHSKIEKPVKDGDYVQRRLRELCEFERRASGEK